MNAITSKPRADKAVSFSAFMGVTIKGKGKAERETAFLSIAVRSFQEGLSRNDLIATLRNALGARPSADELSAAKREFAIGRVASRLPAGELPKGCTDSADKVEFARKLVTVYAAPAKEGTKAKALRKGQEGRRSIGQHRVVRAAEEAWSQVNAELGFGSAQTQSERNSAKASKPRGTSTSKLVTKRDAANAVATTTPVPTDATMAKAHILQQAKSLQDYANKHAALLPAAYGAAVKRFAAAMGQIAADNVR